MLAVFLLAGGAGVGVASAATVGRLPSSVCSTPFALFVDGFDGGAALHREPSGGTGGDVPGAFSRNVSVPGLGDRTYYLHVPAGYSPASPLPLLLALHGAAGSQPLADAAAQQLRGEWGAVGETGGFIVVSPVGSGVSGSWIAPPGLSDYDVFAAVIADVESHYNIDRSRRHAWGLSAGGHVLHDLMLGPYFPTLTADDFAGYGVAAGALAALACSGLGDAGCDVLLATAPRTIPLSLQVGSSDSLRTYVQQDRNRFLANGWANGATLRYDHFGGGHTYTPGQLDRTWDWLCPFQRLP